MSDPASGLYATVDPDRGLGEMRRDLALAYAAFFGAIGAWFPYLPVYYTKAGLDLADVGLLTALAAAVGILASPAWGAATDRFRLYRATLPLAAAVAAVGAVVMFLSEGWLSLAVGALVAAAGTAGIGALLDARTMLLLGDDRLSFGRVRMWGSVSFVASALLTGALVDALGSGWLFAAFIGCVALTALAGARLPGGRGSGRPWALSQVRTLLSDRLFALFLLGTLLEWTAVEAVNSFLSIRIVELGGSDVAVGGAWALSAVAQVPVMFFYARMASRTGLGPLIVVGAAVFAVRAAASALSGQAEMLVLLTTLEGVGFAFFICGAVAFVAQRSSTSLVATGQGLLSGLTFGLGRVVGSSGGGQLAEGLGIAGLFGLAALLGAVAVAVLMHVSRGMARADSQASGWTGR